MSFKYEYDPKIDPDSKENLAKKNGQVDTMVSKPDFPIQDGEDIPVWLAEIAYEGYRNKFGNKQSFNRIRERGGFSKKEIILFIKAYAIFSGQSFKFRCK